MKKYDFVIIGGGIIGLAHAYHAKMLGKSVLVLEKNDKATGASTRNFGQIVPSGFGGTWQEYGRKSVEIYQKIQSEYDIQIRNEGSVYFASDEEEHQLLLELHEINKNNGYASQMLTKQACHTMYPNLKKDYAVSGLYFEDELKAEPSMTLKLFTNYLVHVMGVHVQFHTFVTDIYSNDNEAIAFDSFGEKYICDHLLVCTGDDFQTLYPWFYKKADMEVVKLQMLELIPQESWLKGNILTGWTIRRYESFQECPSYSEIKQKEDALSIQRQYGIHILFKQNMDGSIIVGDSHEYARPDMLSDLKMHETSDFINQFLMEHASQILDLDMTLRRRWVGCYSQVTGQQIFNQRVDSRVRIITGIGGKGMTAGLGWSLAHFEELH
jgi:FAD dependent oxidoreductase TIGR03364